MSRLHCGHRNNNNDDDDADDDVFVLVGHDAVNQSASVCDGRNNLPDSSQCGAIVSSCNIRSSAGAFLFHLHFSK